MQTSLTELATFVEFVISKRRKKTDSSRWTVRFWASVIYRSLKISKAKLFKNNRTGFSLNYRKVQCSFLLNSFALRFKIQIHVFKSLILYEKERTPIREFFLSGADEGIWTLETVFAVYTISNRAPSASSDTSANIHIKYGRFFSRPYNLLYFF